MNSELINDIEKKLDIKLEKSNVRYFTDGASDSIVFAIDNKYLIKTVDSLTYKAQVEFFNTYNNEYFQKLIYSNKELSYLCFEYIVGNKLYNLNNLDINDIISQIYNITSCYKKYDYEGYGDLFDNHNKSWHQFLVGEVNYSKQEIEDISMTKVESALNTIKRYEIDKYLIHGDFGTHNFLINNNEIRVIDPMGVVGDYLYDFYFAIFSDSSIFTKLDLDYILSFYNNDLEYKKALLVIVVYIRMSRAHKYDINNFDKFLELYNKL